MGFDRIGRFVAIGTVGFAIDAVILLALAPKLGPYSARIVSFAFAVTFTWALNRRFTFRDRRSARRIAEWLRYVVTQVAGALVNLAIYAACIALIPSMAERLIVPLAAGSAGGLIVNYCFAYLVAFPTRRMD